MKFNQLVKDGIDSFLWANFTLFQTEILNKERKKQRKKETETNRNRSIVAFFHSAEIEIKLSSITIENLFLPDATTFFLDLWSVKSTTPIKHSFYLVQSKIKSEIFKSFNDKIFLKSYKMYSWDEIGSKNEHSLKKKLTHDSLKEKHDKLKA